MLQGLNDRVYKLRYMQQGSAFGLFLSDEHHLIGSLLCSLKWNSLDNFLSREALDL